ncbi:MAG: NAD(P)-dependent oxidoreductase [Candidatus Aenigmatarchaeota archaeon]
MNWEGMRVCVTGGCGNIGSPLVEKLSDLGAEVLVIDDLSRGNLKNIYRDGNLLPNVKFVHADLTKENVAKTHIKDQDVVVALAAYLAGIVELLKNQTFASYQNSLIDQYTMKAAAENGVKHIVFSSTACTYGKEAPLPAKEENAGGTYDSMYGRTKHYSEFLVKEYAKAYGMKATIFRFFNVYSGKEEFSLKSHVIPGLTYKALNEMDPFVIWGTGEQTRSFIHADDVVRGILLGIEKSHNADPINLGTPEKVKIKDLAYKILEVCDFKPKKILFDTTKPEGVHDRCADNTKAKKILGWEPVVSLDDGLSRTIDDFKKLRQKVGKSYD